MKKNYLDQNILIDQGIPLSRHEMKDQIVSHPGALITQSTMIYEISSI